MDKVLHIRAEAAQSSHKNEHAGYEYVKRAVVPRGAAGHCAVSVYEVPPGKSAYPYHYHTANEEVFYILWGTGTLRTPEGAKTVVPGDFLFFPANASGAHKLTNESPDETLVYIDFGTANSVDVAFYPDSGKVGIWGRNINAVFEEERKVDYYHGE